MAGAFQVLLATFVWLATSTALAASNCTFQNVGSAWRLQADCWTDTTLAIPDGVLLDGRNRTITAVDPEGGHFVGAVVRNAGATAHVRNLTIEGGELADVCDSAGPPDARLRGILFEGASGTIIGNRVQNLRQVGSGCQEGAGIEIRGGLTAQEVVIAANVVEGYQKTGVFVSGDVEVSISGNRITGLGPVSYIAQNGIQLSSGARGTIRWNRVEQNLYTGSDAASTGILLTEAGAPLEITLNRIEDNDLGVRVKSTSDAVVQSNDIAGSTFDGIAIDGLQGAAQGNQLVSNRLADNAIGIDLFGAGATANEVVRNRIRDSALAGIQVTFGATGNDVRSNTVRDSGALDIANEGDNAYQDNRCATSSGPPVDCP